MALFLVEAWRNRRLCLSRSLNFFIEEVLCLDHVGLYVSTRLP